MCSCFQRNKNPQTVKLSIPSSISHLATKSLGTRYANIQSSINDQTAHISLQILAISKSADTKQTSRQQNQRNPRLASRLFQIVACRFHPRRRSCFRFGEAVFRRGRKKPQGEKDRKMTFFSNVQIFHNILGLAVAEPLFCGLTHAKCPLRSAPTPPRAHRQKGNHCRKIQHRFQRPSLHQHHIVDGPGQCRYIGKPM
jgi:hypothetical protein